MAYSPWPSDGCTLVEALKRTVDDAKFHQEPVLIGPTSPQTASSSLRSKVRKRQSNKPLRDPADLHLPSPVAKAEFRRHLIEGRLVAYGLTGTRNSRPKLIPKEAWSDLLEFNFTKSTAIERGRDIPSFTAVRVFPLLHAPCCIELLAAKSLADVFSDFILNDPEVAILGRGAVAAVPLFDRVFSSGYCFARGRNEWPLQPTAEPVGAVRSRSIIGILAEPDPDSVTVAADAITDRYHRLLELISSGKLITHAIRADNGKSEQLSRTVWQHGDFWLDAQKGDIFQVSEDCEEPHEFLKRRWLGVVLDRATVKPNVHYSEDDKSRKRTKTALNERPFSAEQMVAAGSFGPALHDLVLHHPRIRDLRRAARCASQLSGELLYEDAGLLAFCFGHEEKLLPVKFGSREKHELALSENELEEIDERFRSRTPQEFDDLYGALRFHIFWLFETLRRQELTVVAHTINGSQVTINHTIWSNEVYYILPRTSEIFEAVGPRMIKRWVGAAFVAASPSAGLKERRPIRPARASENVGHPRRSATFESIGLAISSLWPAGAPAGLTVKDRNTRIQDWQKTNGLAIASDKSIYRFYQGN